LVPSPFERGLDFGPLSLWERVRVKAAYEMNHENAKTQKTRLWEKGGELDPLVHRFTVGDDPQLDLRLVHFDCLGSAAHARTLERAKLLTRDEAGRLTAELANIDRSAAEGGFAIPDELEDCHTAIESHLTAELGELGEKIHAGRSRNDQIVTAVRLFMRHHVLEWGDAIAATIASLAERIRLDGEVPMPGYTHTQPAMPSSVGLWLDAIAESLLEQMRAALHLFEQLDCCPLGTGAGYGVPLPLDRAWTADLLGFSRVQRNPIDVQNSHGRMETYFVRAAADVAAVLEKFCTDLILFSTAEFGFFSLPEALTTGSSIMPQKRNPDVLELMRARAVRLRARQHELEWLSAKLASGYHRDLQLTKGPVLGAADEIAAMLPIARCAVESFTIHRDRLAAAMRPELFAADAALQMVRNGVPFRQAYRWIADSLRAGEFTPPAASEPAFQPIVRAETLDAMLSDVRTLCKRNEVHRDRVRRAETDLLCSDR
jgi:argininosuccinate lyase